MRMRLTNDRDKNINIVLDNLRFYSQQLALYDSNLLFEFLYQSTKREMYLKYKEKRDLQEQLKDF